MSEEEKAIKRLEEISNNYNLNSEDLHYAKILYYLIINLQKENIQLKIQLLEKKCSDKDIEYKEKIKLQQRIDKAIEYIEKEWYWDGTGIDYVLDILEGKSE